MRRGIGVVVLAFAFGLAASSAAASPLGDARQRERALRSELQAVTSELEARQVAAGSTPVNPYPYVRRACP
jgi:hypothetical protein